METIKLDTSQNGYVAEYLTVLPPKEVLQAKLQQAIVDARLRLASEAQSQ